MFGHSWVKRKGCTCFNLDMDVGTHSRTDFPPILHSFCNHINLVFPAKAKLLLTGQALALNPFISFLPLKHSFEHSLGTWVNVNGVISGRYWPLLWTFMGFPCSSVSKESACSAGSKLQKIVKDGEGRHSVHSVTKSQTWLSDWTTTRQHGGSEVKNRPTNAGDAGWIPRSGRSPEEGNSNPL